MRGCGSQSLAIFRIRSHVVAILLTAPSEACAAKGALRGSGRPPVPAVCRHRVVGEEAPDDLPQPFPLCGDRLVHTLVAAPP